MKPIILLLLLTGPVLAQAGPEDLRIDGEPEVKVGEWAELQVIGLPPLDLEKPLRENLEWKDSFKIITDAPCPVAVESELAIDFLSSTWKLRLRARSDLPCVAVIIADWNQEPFGIAVHRVQFRGDDDPEDPTDPTDPTDPEDPEPGKRFILIVEETGDRTPAFRDFVENLRTDDSFEHMWKLTDEDDTSPEIKKWIDAAGADRPALLISDMEGKVLWTGQCPTDRSEFDKIVTENGG